MSETLAIAPLAWAALPHLTGRLTARSAFLSGLLLSVATLVRFNLAAVALVITLWCLWRTRSVVLHFVLGGALVPLGLAGLYALQGELHTFWLSVFVAPFAYALAGVTVASLSVPQSAIAGALPTAALGTRMPPAIVWVFAVSVALSILASGGGSAHYWIQIHPFSALVLAYLLEPAVERLGRWALLLFALIPVAAGLSDTPWERVNTPSRTEAVVDYLHVHGGDGAPLFLLTEHLAHWRLGSKPLHPMATHPSNLFRAELLRAVGGPSQTPLRVMEEIFAREPLYVVRERSVRRLNDAPESKAYLSRTLGEDYDLEHEIDGVLFYRRR